MFSPASPTAQQFVTIKDWDPWLWDLSGPKPKGQLLEGELSRVGWKDAVYSPDGKTVAIWSNSKSAVVEIWDLSGKAPEYRPLHTEHDEPVQGVAFSSSGRQMATCSYDRTIRVWELDSGKYQLLRTIMCNNNVFTVTFSPTDNLLAAAYSRNKGIFVWDLAEQGQKATLQMKATTGEHRCALRFSQDGKSLFVLDIDSPDIVERSQQAAKKFVAGHSLEESTLSIAQHREGILQLLTATERPTFSR